MLAPIFPRPTIPRRMFCSGGLAVGFLPTLSTKNSAGTAGKLRCRAAPLRTLLYCRQQLVKSFFKKAYPILGELLGDGIDRNSQLRQLAYHCHCGGNVFGQGLSRLSVIPEGIDGRRRHGVHRVWADELCHVQNVGISRILRARARPQHTLRLSALRAEFLPARAGEGLLTTLVGKLAVCDRNFPQQTLQPSLFVAAAGGFQARGNEGIDRVVDTADKEAGDAGYSSRVPAA